MISLAPLQGIAQTAERASNGGTWIIDTRCLPSYAPGGVPFENWNIKRLNDQRVYETSNVTSLTDACTADMPTVILCHGYQTDGRRAMIDGQELRNAIRRGDQRPFRLVIWSWPSQRNLLSIRRDARQKEQRADVESVYLARLLEQTPEDADICLVGYSFGARIVCGALELLEGGQVGGRRLQLDESDNTKPEDRYRVVMIAAAMDYNSLQPGRRYGDALRAVTQALFTMNTRDPALRFYRWLNPGQRQQALGRRGALLSGAGGLFAEVVNVTCQVGKSHELRDYLHASGMAARLPAIVFVDDANATSSEQREDTRAAAAKDGDSEQQPTPAQTAPVLALPGE